MNWRNSSLINFPYYEIDKAFLINVEGRRSSLHHHHGSAKLTILEKELLASRFCLRKDHELGGTLCEGSESCNGWTIEHDVVGNLVRSLFMCSLSMRNYVGVVPPYYSGILNSLNARQDVFESSMYYITIAMMRNYPQLMHKFMSNKAKIPYLLKLIVYMNLHLYSLKRQD